MYDFILGVSYRYTSILIFVINNMHVEMMTRAQVIAELAQYSHPRDYHGLLQYSTDALKALLVWYRKGRHADSK